MTSGAKETKCLHTGLFFFRPLRYNVSEYTLAYCAAAFELYEKTRKRYGTALPRRVDGSACAPPCKTARTQSISAAARSTPAWARDNFSADELQEAVVYCHVRGVKVHLTLNTLVSDREMARAADMVRTAAILGVDAFIVQDLGMVELCREIAPHIPIHASTQMSIHSLEGVQQARELGCTRVVLARELPRDELAPHLREKPGGDRDFRCMARFVCAIPGSAISRPSSAGAAETAGSAPSRAGCRMATGALSRTATRSRCGITA